MSGLEGRTASRSSVNSSARGDGRPRRRDAAPPGTPGPPTAAVGTFVGRQEELAGLSELVARSPVLTLTGPPGVGKSRLAREVVSRLPAELGERRFADLTVVADSDLVAEGVAAALGVREEPGRPLLDTLAAHVGGEARLVLVLDGCEHVVEGAAEVVGQLVGRCRGLRVVATSQERLRIAGEAVWEVSPLSVPTPSSSRPEEVSESEAVELFCERARSARAGFGLSATNALAVAEICRHLDGIPLAIELAAALMSVSSPEVVAGSLDARFALLRGGARCGPARHQTLAAAIEWSYGLLAPPEQALLRRLSVFAGGASAEGVRQVCAEEGQARGEVLGLLTRLVERSLVAVDPTPADPRYHLLESICQFAADKAAEAGKARAGRQRHLGWCRSLALAAAARGGGPPPAFLVAEEDNVRAALEWATAEGDSEAALVVAGAYLALCRRAGRYREARQWVERVLVLPEAVADAAPRRQRLLDAASLASVAGDLDAALAWAEEALGRLSEDAAAGDQAEVLALMGFLSLLVRDPDAALETLEGAVALARASAAPGILAEALVALGRARILVGELHRAQGHFAEALAGAARAGEPVVEAEGHVCLGWAALVLGDYEPARSHLDEASALADALGANHLRAVAAAWSGELARLQGAHEAARSRFGVALEVARAIDTPYPSVRALVGLAWLAFDQGHHEAALARGDEALVLARRSANGYVVAPALQVLGALSAARGDAAAARGLLGQALAVARARHDRLSEAAALDHLGRLAASQGDPAGAATAQHQALVLRAGVGHRVGVVESLEALGGLSIAGGRVAHGLRLLGAAQGLRDRHGYPRPAHQGEVYNADTDAARAALSGEAFARAFAEGAGLGLDEAVAYARRGRGSQRRAPMGWAALTAAERRVAELVGEGLTNPQIAQRLFVSPRTVQTHLRHIFAKLGVGTRAALMREAQRH